MSKCFQNFLKKVDSCKHLLHVLQSANPALQRAIIQYGKPELITTLSEICLNVVHGNIHISTAALRKLRRYKGAIRQLANSRKRDVQLQRRILLQRGGFLGAVVAAMAYLFKQLLGK